MNTKKIVNENRFVQELRNKEIEYMIIFAVDSNGNEIPYWKEIGDKKQVKLSSDGIDKMMNSSEYSSFFIVHNHPHSEKNKMYWYFSMEDIKFYQKLKEMLNGAEMNLLDFFVVSKNKTLSMKELVTIL